MGYRPQRTIYRIRYEQYPDLLLRATPPSLGELTYNFSIDPTSLPQSEVTKRMIGSFNAFFQHIVEWNVEHPEVILGKESDPTVCAKCGLREGDVLPRSLVAARCLEPDFLGSLQAGWLEGVSGVSAEKKELTKSGEPALMTPAELAKMIANRPK